MTTINDLIKKGKVRKVSEHSFFIQDCGDKEAMDIINNQYKNGEVYRKPGETDLEYMNRTVPYKSEATIESVCDALKEFLLAKNKNYGNSATEPLNIFSNLSNIERMKCRMDEKISRIKNSPCDRVNDYVDLLGYLVLVCKLNGWDNFMDMVD